jgi:hypothetical protein
LERLILDRLAKIILKHPALSTVTAADHNVAETYVMIWTWRTTADTDHESDADIWEVAKHVSCYGRTVLPVGQDGNHNIMIPDPAQGIIVVIVLGHFSRALVFFVEESLGSDKLGGKGADPANCVVPGVHHDLRYDAKLSKSKPETKSRKF